MASLDTDVTMVPAGEGPSDAPPSFSAASASLSSKKAKRFEIKKWNAVALWAWDIVMDNCAICRNHITDLCIECQTNQASATSEESLMEGLLPPCSVPEDPRVSVCSDRNVAFELLDGDLRKTYSHFQFECSDDSVARQIKTLAAENLVLCQKAEDSYSRVLLDGNSSSLSFVPVGKPPSPTSWKDIVAPVNPLISRMNLHYCPPAVVNNDLYVNIPESVASAGVDRWKDWVVGYFVDRKLHFTAVETIAHKIWDQFGLLDVLSNENGFFFFHFDKSELWTEGLSHVASAIGKPLYADHLTESCKRISFAKICVEVDASAPLPESFGLSLPSGAKFTIRVWYPWKPLMSGVGGQNNWGDCPSFTHAASVSSSIVDDSAGVSAVVASVLSPAGVSDKGDPVLENPPKESVMVGTEVVFLPQPLCSSSGTMDGENMFSILQSDVGQAFFDPDGVLISLPTDEEFNEGLIVENSEIPSPKIGAVSCFPSHWLSVHNYSVGPVARIFLGWDPTVFVSSILFSSDQLIVSEFLPLDGSASFVLSVVYGHNRAVDRRQLWDDMRTIANSVAIQTKVPHHLSIRGMLVAPVTVTEIKAALMFINGDTTTDLGFPGTWFPAFVKNPVYSPFTRVSRDRKKEALFSLWDLGLRGLERSGMENSEDEKKTRLGSLKKANLLYLTESH
ncbi:hypothetical protein RHGRI_013973 [Rhododendron griersonianum]|uniref:Uncharacterized protein n=1 Tax=Rhododendron griersonianum TaxID=479676 RepID=A0AAV6K7L0_9ERIC|nr:hypothetical protein RHGRI_013973 [Rhododendron griersonianum]